MLIVADIFGYDILLVNRREVSRELSLVNTVVLHWSPSLVNTGRAQFAGSHRASHTIPFNDLQTDARICVRFVLSHGSAGERHCLCSCMPSVARRSSADAGNPFPPRWPQDLTDGQRGLAQCNQASTLYRYALSCLLNLPPSRSLQTSPCLTRPRGRNEHENTTARCD